MDFNQIWLYRNALMCLGQTVYCIADIASEVVKLIVPLHAPLNQLIINKTAAVKDDKHIKSNVNRQANILISVCSVADEAT